MRDVLLIFQLLSLGVEKVAKSTADAFAQFYEQYLPKVFRYVSYRIADRPTAEDLTSTVFEKALTKFKSYDAEKANIATWVITIARNTLTDYFRSHGRYQTVQLDETIDVPEEADSIEETLERQGDCKLLNTCLERLSGNEREIISLKFGADMTNRHIAGLLGLSESNVGVILYRAVRKLRDEFQGRV